MIASDVQQIINEELPTDKLTGIDIQTFIYAIPDNVRSDNKITVLISELPNKPTLYGSNVFRQKDNHVGLKIYFPYMYEEDFDDLVDDITDIMESHGWYFMFNQTLTDPETDRACAMVDFHKYYFRKKEF